MGIYAIRSESGHIKFGVARNVKSRASELSVGCPFQLRVLAFSEAHSFDMEAKIHKALSTHRVRGEWFIECPLAHTLAALMDSPFFHYHVESHIEQCPQAYWAEASRIAGRDASRRGFDFNPIAWAEEVVIDRQIRFEKYMQANPFLREETP